MATLKEFDPQAGEPGAVITWTHVRADGTKVARTGVIWSLAPLVRGNCASVWVVPDEPDPADPYPPAVLVLTPYRSARIYAAGGVFTAGQAFSEVGDLTHTGSYALVAARSAARAA